MANSALKRIEGASELRGFRFPPKAFKVIPELNSRGKSPSDSEIEQMAESIHQFGQLQPVQFRWAEKEDVEKYPGVELQDPLVIMGQTRVLAMQTLVDVYPEKKWLTSGLLWNPKTGTDVDIEGFVLSLVENVKRTNPDDISLGKAILKLQAAGKTLEEIGSLMGRGISWVQQHIQLVTELDKGVQRMVQNKELPWSHAQKVLEIPKEQQKEFLESLAAEGPVTRDRIVEAKRKKREETGEKPPQRTARTSVQMKKYFTGRLETEVKNSAIFIISDLMLDFLSGEIDTDQKMDNRLNKYFGVLSWDPVKGMK